MFKRILSVLFQIARLSTSKEFHKPHKATLDTRSLVSKDHRPNKSQKWQATHHLPPQQPMNIAQFTVVSILLPKNVTIKLEEILYREFKTSKKLRTR